MTDRELLEQALEALLLFERAGLGTTGTVEAITTLRERLARCDDCGKPLGIDGHIHTCSPKTRTITYICPVCAASLERQE